MTTNWPKIEQIVVKHRLCKDQQGLTWQCSCGLLIGATFSIEGLGLMTFDEARLIHDAHLSPLIATEGDNNGLSDRP